MYQRDSNYIPDSGDGGGVVCDTGYVSERFSDYQSLGCNKLQLFLLTVTELTDPTVSSVTQASLPHSVSLLSSFSSLSRYLYLDNEDNEHLLL